jgi:hypothetical protein
MAAAALSTAAREDPSPIITPKRLLDPICLVKRLGKAYTTWTWSGLQMWHGEVVVAGKEMDGDLYGIGNTNEESGSMTGARIRRTE